jgi:hypothetical protein
MRNAYKVLEQRTEGERQLGRPGRRLDDNIKMDFKEMVWESVDWIHLALVRDQWRAVVNKVMNHGFHKRGRMY